MTRFVRWKPGTIAAYQYFEITTQRWVDCDKTLYRHFLHEGPVHMNPTANPAVILAAELRRAA